MSASRGAVFLVGAGPGDPGLITRRGADLLARADIVVYDGLVGDSLLDISPPHCVCIYAGKKRSQQGAPLTQEQINQLLVDHALMGKRVVRLKGGDGFVFGRGAEECQTLADAGIDFEIVPGVTAATAVPAYAGIPLTARGVASTVAFATGHEAAGKPATDIDWRALAHASTIVLFMAVRTMADCARHLIAAGKPADTPAAVIRWGTTAAQQTVVAPLKQLPEAARAAGIGPPALVVIGPVVSLRSALSWRVDQPLFGARVALTRPLASAAEASRAITALGGEPVALPVTAIEPLFGPQARPDTDADATAASASDPSPLSADLDRITAQLDAYHWLLLTSANAARHFLDLLIARGRDARALANARIACVGARTAAALRERGLLADVVPERGGAVAVAQAMIAASTESLRGARVLFPRALHGRDEAVLALREVGADVEILPVYRSVESAADQPVLQRGLRKLRAGQIHILGFFAPSQVNALCDLLGADARALISACPVVAAIGRTTRAALLERGVTVDIVSPATNADSLLRAAAQAWRERAPAPVFTSPPVKGT